MMNWRLVAIFLVFAATGSAAEQCPTRAGDEILALLDQAPTCETSLALFQVCAYGASGDVGLSEVVIDKCESVFRARLSRSQRRAYQAGQARCARKYRNESGSLYRSAEAFCRADLAKSFADRFAKGPAGQPAMRP